MKSRARPLFLASFALVAGSLCASTTWAGTNLPALKVDPRLLGLPALETVAPSVPVPPATKPEVATPATDTPAPTPAPALSAPPVAQPQPLAPVPPPPVVEAPAPVVIPAPAQAQKPAHAKPTESAPVAPAKPARITPPPAPEPVKPPVLAKPIPEPTPLIPPPIPSVAGPISAEPPEIPPEKRDDTPPNLQLSMSLPPRDTKVTEKTPLFLSAMRLTGKTDDHIEAEEEVELRKLGLRVNADTLRYDEVNEVIDAKGNVRLQTLDGVMKGPDLHLKLADETGHMNTPEYAIAAEQAHGKANKLTFLGDDRYRMEQGSYSTCAVDNEDWWLRATQLEIDRTANRGVGHNTWIEFKGLPIFYTPYISFPLKKERKSGFLTPSFGTTGNSGLEFSIPYYWNIAPNYDATITPRVMSRRGVQLSGEFRYLQQNYSGEIHGEFLPNDQAANRDRHAYRLQHRQNFGAGFSGNLDIQRVSDDDYFRDLSSLVATTSQTILPREGNLLYSHGPWSAAVKMQRFQILQDRNNPIAVPYERVPQVTANYTKLNQFGFADVRANAEYVAFDHPTSVKGSRFTIYPSISVPFTRSFGYVTPKLGVHHTQYNLDRNTTALPDSSRTLPIFSLDSGLTFERDTRLFGRAVTQTLEPRLYYLYVPFKDQSRIPNFDSGEADFNFAQIFSENRFSGGDRVSDANQVTLALTSRFLESESGLERLRASVAQRYFFRTPRVTLSSAAPRDKISDFLASIGGQITPAWSADATWQYDPNTSHTKKYNVGARYNPEPNKLLNMAYRFDRNNLRQVDVSGQWPVAPRWQVMGRWNYSIQDRRTLETLGGIEYTEGCWAVRIVAHRFQTATQKTTNALFLQLELTGLSSLGTNPINVLKQNIGGYTQTQPRLDPINLDEF